MKFRCHACEPYDKHSRGTEAKKLESLKIFDRWLGAVILKSVQLELMRIRE